MKKIITLLLFTLSASLSTLSAQGWIWARQGNFAFNNTTTAEAGEIWNDHAIFTDNSGNVYATGFLDDTILFGSYKVSGGQGGNMYLVKYDANGTPQWASQSNYGTVYASGYGIAADGSGNAYVVGNFLGSISFGTDTLNYPYYNGYIAKFDHNGNFVWARQGIPSQTTDVASARGVGVDGAGNIYMVGYFSDTISFGSVKLPTQAGEMFLVKYDLNGNVIWAKDNTPTHHAGSANGMSISVDASGNSVVTGYFSDTIYFGATMLTGVSSAYGNMFIVKFDSAGNVLWAAAPTLGVGTSGIVGNSVSVDKFGGCYLTGYYTGTVFFGTHAISGSLYGNLFLAKYDKNGSPMWAEAGNPLDNNQWEGFAVASDSAEGGGYLIFSDFYGAYPTSPFNIKIGNQDFTASNSGTATVMLQFDSSGNSTCGKIFTEGGEDDFDGVCASPNGQYVYNGGDFSSTGVLGHDSIIIPAGIHSHELPYIGRWQECDQTVGISKIPANISTIEIYPNPTSGEFYIQCSGIRQWSVEVYNVLGEKVYSQLNITNSTFNINLSPQPNGIYLVKLIGQDGTVEFAKEIIIQK